MKIRCISCDQTVQVKDLFVCPLCGYEFKAINGIPIFLKDGDSYISNKILSIGAQMRDLEQSFINEPNSLYGSKFEQINKAIVSQIDILEDLRAELIKECSVPALLQCIGTVEKNGYDMTFEYLIRDWSLLPETEEEIGTIRKAIFSKLPSGRRESVLVLGAGLGRIAFDLLDEYKEVYAIDLSMEMPYLLVRLLTSGRIDLTYYHKKNVADQESLLVDYSILSPAAAGKVERLNDGKLNYFVADVTDLPLPDGYFDAIVSCYFTDVLPLQSIMGEITRVLAVGGTFVHFGPLDFHFREARNFLTYKEVLEVFSRYGYETKTFDAILLEHVSLPNRFKKKVYNNQLFTARKCKTRGKGKLSGRSILKMKSAISFSLQGTLTEDGEIGYSRADFTAEDGLFYEGALAVFEVLRRLDGKKELKAVFAEMAEEYSVNNDLRKKLFSILKKLDRQGVIGRAD